MIVNFIPFKTDKIIRTQEDKNTWVRDEYSKLKDWRQIQPQQIHLDSLQDITTPGILRLDNLLVLDFDNTSLFEEAIDLNNSLQTQYQCNYIVRSSRKGGHMYYSTPPTTTTHIRADQLPWKKSEIDILTGNGHNVFAPTQGDAGKQVITPPLHNTPLNPLPEVFLPFLVYCITKTTTQSGNIVTQIAGGTYSDDNESFIDRFLTNQLPRQDFLKYYNLPDIMPSGQSQNIMLRLAHRLLKDETLPLDKVRQTLHLYDKDNRKTQQEVNGLTPLKENIYIENKHALTSTWMHHKFKTQISVYMDEDRNSYIITYMDDSGNLHQKEKHSEGDLLQFMEKAARIRRNMVKNSIHHILPVRVIKDFTQKAGFDPLTDTYNSGYTNEQLAAFRGQKPLDYTTPDRLIKLCQYMWGEEYDFLLTHTHLRYSNFKHTPVIHHLMGTQGSGKDLTVRILTAGFTLQPQIVTPEDVTDKHRSYQVEDNAVFQEVGDWNPKSQMEAISGIKSVTGGNGYISVRGMGTMKQTIPTICKLWVLGNSWMKLHTGASVDRRVHAVYMPHTLNRERGGPYLDIEIKQILATELTNFYYYLGNEYQLVEPERSFMDPLIRQKSTSYQIYLEATEGPAEQIAVLLSHLNFQSLLEAISKADGDLQDLEFKYNQNKNLIITVNSLQTLFGRVKGAKVILETVDLLASEISGKLHFDSGLKRYIIVYGAPYGLGSGAVETLTMEKTNDI